MTKRVLKSKWHTGDSEGLPRATVEAAKQRLAARKARLRAKEKEESKDS